MSRKIELQITPYSITVKWVCMFLHNQGQYTFNIYKNVVFGYNLKLFVDTSTWFA